VYATKNTLLLEVLIVYYFARDFTDHSDVCWIHEANVKQSNRKAGRQFTLRRLIAFFLQILDLFEIGCFEHKIERLNFSILVMEIDLILAVAKHGIIKPAEASYLTFVVKKLKSDGI